MVTTMPLLFDKHRVNNLTHTYLQRQPLSSRQYLEQNPQNSCTTGEIESR